MNHCPLWRSVELVMSDFLSDLLTFLTSPGGLEPNHPNLVFIFVCGCAVVGLLGFVLDICHYFVRQQSLFQLNYTRKTWPIILLGWVVGASVAGYLGQIFNILQTTLLASATVALGWPIVAQRMVAEAKSPSATAPSGGNNPCAAAPSS